MKNKKRKKKKKKIGQLQSTTVSTFSNFDTWLDNSSQLQSTKIFYKTVKSIIGNEKQNVLEAAESCKHVDIDTSHPC